MDWGKVGMPGGLGSSPVWWLEAPVSFMCRISVQSCAAEVCASHAGRVGGRWGADGRAGQAGGAGGEKALTPFPSLAAG